MAIFADVQYCIYADKVGGVQKKPKICWHNIGMVPRERDCNTYFGRANNDKNTANQVNSKQYDADDKEIKHDIGQICNFFILFWW